MSSQREDLAATIEAHLASFGGSDAGRSVSFRAAKPSIAPISIRGGVPRPAASVAKVPLAMSVYRKARHGMVDLEMRVAVETFSATRYVSILTAFDRGRTLSLREITRLALITSDNPLAVHLQTLTDFPSINALLREIGCGPGSTMTAGFSESELGPRNRVNTLTADDALILIDALRRDQTYADLMTGLENNLRNNRIPALLPDHVAIIHKTGSLEGVVNDVGIVRDDAVDFTIAFLTDEQVDPEATSRDIATCSAAIYTILAG